MLRRLVEKARIWLWSRDQNNSLPLRRYFKDHFQIDVGLYSYGCFDPWRFTGPVKVGRYCSVAKTARVIPGNHPYTALTTHPALYESQFGVVEADINLDRELIIEDDVWIGHHALIMPSCSKIGRGAIIGAGAIVTSDVAPYSIMVGAPARQLKMRFSDATIAAIEASQWWKMSTAELREFVKAHPDIVYDPVNKAIPRIGGKGPD